MYGLHIAIIAVGLLSALMIPSYLNFEAKITKNEPDKKLSADETMGEKAPMKTNRQINTGSNIISLLRNRNNPEKQKEALRELYSERRHYKNDLMGYISQERNWDEWNDPVTKDNVFEVVLLIAGLSGDRDYVPPMMKLLQNDKYITSCIYNCALTFSLSLLCHEKDIAKIKAVENAHGKYEYDDIIDSAAYAVISGWKNMRNAKPASIDIRKKEARNAILYSDPEKQKEYNDIIELVPDELLKIAGDRKEDDDRRYMAITALSYLADDMDSIDDLLFILLTLDPKYFDGADEYHGSIIKAMRNILIRNGKK